MEWILPSAMRCSTGFRGFIGKLGLDIAGDSSSHHAIDSGRHIAQI
jgi:hypothetical protein